MHVEQVQDASVWESFLQDQQWSPFLQSFTMGEVYTSLGEEAVRIVAMEGGIMYGVCQGIVVPARRGKHLAILYGPVVSASLKNEDSVSPVTSILLDAMENVAAEKHCSFMRMSPFMPSHLSGYFRALGWKNAPLHMLAEHIWHLGLKGKSEEDILAGMRKTTRNLIRRAEKEGVTVRRSDNPLSELSLFFNLYDETRKRHGFVPYSNSFITSQVEKFSVMDQCTLYIAEYNGEPVASSVHMIYGGETSYHHGASSSKYPKCYASYLLQWRAIQNALKRGDHVYNFWGIAPCGRVESGQSFDPTRASDGKKWKVENSKHPFAGVTTFKTGFGGNLLDLVPCMDFPISSKYYITWGFEMLRKWKRGF